MFNPEFFELARRPAGDTDNANVVRWQITPAATSINGVAPGQWEIGYARWNSETSAWVYSWDEDDAESVTVTVAAFPYAFNTEEGEVVDIVDEGDGIYSFTLTGQSITAWNTRYENIDLSGGGYVQLQPSVVTESGGELSMGPNLMIWPEAAEGVVQRSLVTSAGAEVSTDNPYTLEPIDDYRDLIYRTVATTSTNVVTTFDVTALNNAYTEGAVRPAVPATYLSKASGTTPLGPNANETFAFVSFEIEEPAAVVSYFNVVPGLTMTLSPLPETRFIAFRTVTNQSLAVNQVAFSGWYSGRVHMAIHATPTTFKASAWDSVNGWTAPQNATGTYTQVNLAMLSATDLFGRSDRPLQGDIYRAAVYAGPTGTLPDPLLAATRERISSGANLLDPQAFEDLLGAGAERRLLLEGADGAAAWNAGLAGAAPYLNGDGSAFTVTGSFVDV